MNNGGQSPVVDEVAEFLKNVKTLRKKFRTLDDDVELVKKALITKFPEHPSGSIRISGLGKKVKIPIFKLRHFRCRALKGKGSRSGIRLIYAYELNPDKITLLEIYYKGNKETEDRQRILKYFQGK